jgi:hypothetical protein
MRLPGAGIAFAILLLPHAGAAQPFSILMENGAFRVSGWTPPKTPPAAGWPSIFAVYAGAGDVPPLLGSYSTASGSLVFEPRFRVAPGIRTRAVFRPPSGAAVETLFDGTQAPSAPSTSVEHVYPSAEVLPENQLKFYIHFSAPMSRGEAWEHIHLLDQNGNRVDLPFLEIDQELWDAGQQRLTVLFDPGRIKRGVRPLDEVGPAIEHDKRYTLVIDSSWRDARGNPLRDGFRKSFRVAAAERSALDPAQWRLTVPQAGSVDAVVLDLPRPADAALLRRLIDIPGVEGTVTLAANESQWRFVPRKPWQAGGYTLVIDTALEDLAGNRVGRAFDVDVFDPVTKVVERKTVSLPFRIGQH